MCCFNRPYDDQTQARVRLETEAKLLIQENIKDGRCRLVWSSILDFECSKNPFPEHRQAILQWRRLADRCIQVSPKIASRAKQLESQAVARFDAQHVACALASEVDLFVTTDDRLLKRLRKLDLLAARLPGEALATLEHWYED
ncbi:PIN domain protein [Thiorhodococcus mannitoliphagus]|uniref:PIN domain protein n=1 Tax=Thiorhodococcus mannitoliphagus TaxID=329406 RepID=A0A6P1DUK8_9GAMM|nr:PIN domain protein [Thiorhodococcus mannitoliphagus]NEX20376.1 PIN domain protein [Thiorhodococcus mannitoliphagus]